MATMQVFLSHSSTDRDVAESVVTALRGAGADVWFDEHNLGPGQLLKEITRELRARPVFLVLLSEQAIASAWVQNECEWAFTLRMSDPGRIILPVVVAPLKPNAMDELLYLSGFKRIEGPNHTPYAHDEMIARTLRLLALTPAGETPAPMTPQPTESVDDLITQGDALAAQQRWEESLSYFQRATERDASNAEAWGSAGWMLGELERYAEALTACDRSLSLNDQQAWVWCNKGNIFNNLQRHKEALVTFDHALELNPELAAAWYNKGIALKALQRYEEALVAFDRAIALAPDDPDVWNNKGNALSELTRHEEALVTYDHALALDPDSATTWYNKGLALNALQQYEEAVVAFNHVLALDPDDPDVWYSKGIALYYLKRYEESLAAFDRGFDRNDPRDWKAQALVYRALGRVAEAAEAERQAQELGG